MYCSKCGTDMGSASYCPKCGAPADIPEYNAEVVGGSSSVPTAQALSVLTAAAITASPCRKPM